MKNCHSVPMHDAHVGSNGWISTPHIAPDFRGPKDDSFGRFIDPAIAPPIIEILKAVAERQPDQTAFDDEGGCNITFAAFWRAVNRLAARIERTPASGAVGILLPIGTLYAVAVFACLAARRISVLLDENYPEERMQKSPTRRELACFWYRANSRKDAGANSLLRMWQPHSPTIRRCPKITRLLWTSTLQLSYSRPPEAKGDPRRWRIVSVPCFTGCARFTTQCTSSRMTGCFRFLHRLRWADLRRS